MAIGFEICLLLFASLLLLLSGFLLLEVMAASLSPKSLPNFSRSRQGSLTVLMPAHNEESIIAATLTNLAQQLDSLQQVVVVADNCSDRTAEVAASLGARVVERHDPARAGKGYALDFGLKTLQTDPPDVVIMIDADCEVAANGIETLKQQVLATGRPVQAVYLMDSPAQRNLKAQLSAFAFKLKNWVRPLGLQRIGGPCLLTGTGMAFPWAALSSLNLANGHLAEDMKLGIDLAVAGYTPYLCTETQVFGQLPETSSASTRQRTRWEHGHLQILQEYVPRLWVEAIKQRRWDLGLLAWDLAIPPLSLLVLVGMVLAGLGATLAELSAIWLPFGVTVDAGIYLFFAILIAWYRFGRSDLPPQVFLMLPLYLLWKIPLYLRFLINPENQWVRTERDVSEG